MKYLVQIKQFGFAQIDADSWEAAREQAEELPTSEFVMSNDCDIDYDYENPPVIGDVIDVIQELDE